ATGIFRGLPLCIIEIGRDRDHAFRDGLAKESVSVALELPEDERGNLRGSERLSTQLDAQHFAGLKVFGETKWKQLQLVLNIFNPTSHKAFDRIHGTFRRLNQELTRRIANDDFVVLIECDD